MKRIILFLLLVACLPQLPVKNESVQNVTPQNITIVQTLVQCWDNSTAKTVEECPKRPAKVVVELPPIKLQPGREFLEQAKAQFSAYAYLLEDRMVIVVQNKSRHLFSRLSKLDDDTPITDVFVDHESKAATAYCNIDRESHLGSFDYERSKCKDYLNQSMPVPFEKWVVKGPLEWLEEFADREPILVEDNVQTISIGGTSKSIQPSLHYMVDGKRVILRLDKRYHVPLKIEWEGQKAVDFRDTFFDLMVLEGKQYKVEASWVTPQPVSEYWFKGNTK